MTTRRRQRSTDARFSGIRGRLPSVVELCPPPPYDCPTPPVRLPHHSTTSSSARTVLASGSGVWMNLANGGPLRRGPGKEFLVQARSKDTLRPSHPLERRW